MAAELSHPVLISSFLKLDTITVNGQVLEFKHVFYTWCAMAILFTVGILVRKRLALTPSGLQNVFESIVAPLNNAVTSSIGDAGKKLAPFLIAIFLFILTQNLLGLVPLFDAPTANVNTNLAMALLVFIAYNLIGMLRWGPGYIKHFCGPVGWLAPLMLPIELISHVARPMSLTLRLFGNIRGEEIVLVIFFSMLPLISTLPIYFLFLLAKSLQAFIFFTLTTLYFKGACEHAH